MRGLGCDLSRRWRCAADAALPKTSTAARDSVAVGVFRRGARRWGSPRRKIPEAAVHVSAILEPEGDSERRPHLFRLFRGSLGGETELLDAHCVSAGSTTANELDARAIGELVRPCPRPYSISTRPLMRRLEDGPRTTSTGHPASRVRWSERGAVIERWTPHLRGLIGPDPRSTGSPAVSPGG
jgi:hypothetical protein